MLRYQKLLVAGWLLMCQSVYINYSTAGETLVLANGEWAPYSSEYLPHYGYASHLVSAAFAEVGIEVDYQFYENAWKRAYENASRGRDELGQRVDGSLVWFHTPEREKAFYFSQPIILEHHLLFHLSNKPLHWKQVSDLQGKLIGAPLHMALPTLEKAEKEGILSLVRETESYGFLFRMLATKSIDAVVIDEQVGKFYLERNRSQFDRLNITYSPTKIEPREYHLILSRKYAENKKRIEQFNLGMQKLAESGKLKVLQDRLSKGDYFR